MLILILINVQYLQLFFLALNEKCLNGQIHSSSYYHKPIKQFSLPSKGLYSASPLTVVLFEKPCTLLKEETNLR